jgi:hypothetical protein
MIPSCLHRLTFVVPVPLVGVRRRLSAPSNATWYDTIFQPNDCHKEVTADYPARTTPFIILDNLILEIITEKQRIIEPVTENMPPERSVINALRNTPSEIPSKTIFRAGEGYLPTCFARNEFLKWGPSRFIRIIEALIVWSVTADIGKPCSNYIEPSTLRSLKYVL